MKTLNAKEITLVAGGKYTNREIDMLVYGAGIGGFTGCFTGCTLGMMWEAALLIGQYHMMSGLLAGFCAFTGFSVGAYAGYYVAEAYIKSQ